MWKKKRGKFVRLYLIKELKSFGITAVCSCGVCMTEIVVSLPCVLVCSNCNRYMKAKTHTFVWLFIKLIWPLRKRQKLRGDFYVNTK